MPKVGELGSGPPLKPYWTSSGGGRVRMYLGHVTDVLARLPERSVHCCVTSPPYWGLRSYLPDGHEQKGFELGAEPSPDCGTKGQAQCGRCFVCNMVAVFRGVRRVLRDDGTLWLNLGDSYGGFGGGKQHGSKQRSNPGSVLRPIGHGQRTSLADGNLVGVPWRVALALQGDGWVLRQDVIWHKPAPMPESVRNRCTKAHEYVFLLTKGPGVLLRSRAAEDQAHYRFTVKRSNQRRLDMAGSYDRRGGKYLRRSEEIRQQSSGQPYLRSQGVLLQHSQSRARQVREYYWSRNL